MSSQPGTSIDAFNRARTLSAALVVCALVAVFAVAAYAWADDVQALWEKIPVAAKTISKSGQGIMRHQRGSPIGEMKKAASEIEREWLFGMLAERYGIKHNSV